MVNIGSIRPKGRAPKTMDRAVAQYCGWCQSTPKTLPERSVYMDYHVLMWKIKITGDKTGAPPDKEKAYFR